MNDHVVSFRFAPRGARSTDVEALWFVRPDTVAGVDYNVDELLWLWDATLQQDKAIVENNQLGTQSCAYQPGLYTHEEVTLSRFMDWTASKIADPLTRRHSGR